MVSLIAMVASSFYFKKSICMVLVFTSWTFMVGCSKRGLISENQLMLDELPQNFHLAASAEKVWKLVSKEIKQNPNYKIITNLSKSYVISFSEKVKNWRDLRQDAAGPEFSLMANPNIFNSKVNSTGEGTALTTIWIERSHPGSLLHVRRIFTGLRSFAGIGHSRGDYERDLFKRIQYLLGEENIKF